MKLEEDQEATPAPEAQSIGAAGIGALGFSSLPPILLPLQRFFSGVGPP